MNKGLIISASIFILLSGIYIGSYLSLREVKIFDRQGYWIIYFYGDAFVRQYAVDDQAQQLFKKAVKSGDRSFFRGNEGATGQDWFCVYRKPDTKLYRLYRLIEEIENCFRARKRSESVNPDSRERANSIYHSG